MESQPEEYCELFSQCDGIYCVFETDTQRIITITRIFDKAVPFLNSGYKSPLKGSSSSQGWLALSLFEAVAPQTRLYSSTHADKRTVDTAHTNYPDLYQGRYHPHTGDSTSISTSPSHSPLSPIPNPS